jgi:tetratricopeptide (TPR) repeat protein
MQKTNILILISNYLIFSKLKSQIWHLKSSIFHIYFWGFILLSFAACKHDNIALKKEIVQYEKDMLKDTTGFLDKSTASKFIQTSVQLAEQTEPDTAAANLYFKAASVARSLNDFPKSIEIWKKVIEKFPTHENAPLAIFLTAFTYENDLHLPDKAKAAYYQLIEKYPNHELAVTAKVVMQHFDKSPEELIKLYEANDSLPKIKK